MLVTLLFLHATVQAALLGQGAIGTALAGDLCPTEHCTCGSTCACSPATSFELELSRRCCAR